MESNYLEIINDVLLKSQNEDYKGYEKFDALNSPFIDTITLKNQWLRFFAIQIVKESPLHIRPLLGVKKMQNTKGMALFARSNLFLYESEGKAEYLEEARKLIEWLLINNSPNQKNYCWGYEFLWQSVPPFRQDRNEPNLVVTCFVGEAICHFYKHDPQEKYLEILRSITKFITEDLPVLYEDETSRAISYLLSKVDFIALNNQVMSAALLVKINKYLCDDHIRLIAKKQCQYTANYTTDYYCWAYAVPLKESKRPVFINYHDNYHTGGILDAFLEYYEETGDEAYNEIYWKGLTYYKEHLFTKNGIPKWSNKKNFPVDIHSCSQGIITFVKAARYDKNNLLVAKSILEWTINNMYRKNRHDFIYRKSKFYKWNFTLVRWCNGWMTRAISEFILNENKSVK